MLTRGQLWRQGRDRLAAKAIDTAALDARVLLQFSLGLTQTQLIASETDPVSEGDIATYDALILRRLAHEPVARIRGVQEFYGLEFGLNAATLIPRPETEMLVDFGIDRLKAHPAPNLLDLGAGTGCIGLSLLDNLPKASGTGIDLDPDAVRQMAENARYLGLDGRYTALEGNWFSPVSGAFFDLIVSNPPYITPDVIEGLAPEVALYDPRLALDGGPDGLAPYRIITDGALNHLNPGGTLAFEIGFDQGAAVAALLESAGFARVAVTKDLAGHDRMVTGYRAS